MAGFYGRLPAANSVIRDERSPGAKAGALALDYLHEDLRLIQRPGQHDAALDRGDNLDGSRPRRRFAPPAGPQGRGQRRDPLLEVRPDHVGEPVTLPPEREGALQADAPTRAEVVGDRVEHGGYRGRIAGPRAPQRFEDGAGEPGVDVGEHGRGHLLLAAGEEMVEAALPEPGRLAEE